MLAPNRNSLDHLSYFVAGGDFRPGVEHNNRTHHDYVDGREHHARRGFRSAVHR